MRYTKKKEILEHLGKNGRDVKGLDRLIRKGVVIERDGRYAYRGDLEIAHIRKLKEQLKEKSEWRVGDNRELEEAKAQWRYYEEKYNEEVEDKQERIRKCFRRIQQIKPRADWEEFRNWVMSDED